MDTLYSPLPAFPSLYGVRLSVCTPSEPGYISMIQPGGCHPNLRNVSAFSVNFHLNRWRYSHVTSFLANYAAMFLGPWACGSECCRSNSNGPGISQKGLIGIQSHHSRKKMSKKARDKPAEAGSASVSPYGSVLGYELVTSQSNRLINLIWPECRTWFIGPWIQPLPHQPGNALVSDHWHWTCYLWTESSCYRWQLMKQWLVASCSLVLS